MKRILLAAILITISGCNKKETSPETITVLDTYPAEMVDTTQFNSDEPEKVTIYKNIWSGKDLGLPLGKIVMMDYSGRTTENSDIKNNYVVIRTADSLMVIRRDIDEDTYLSISIGDIIK